jgi:hypothetical protein
MTREERVEQLLGRDRELMTRLRTANPDELPALLRQRKEVKSQMNLYGPEAVARWMRQEFPEIEEAEREEEERRKRLEQRWAKNPEVLREIRKAAVG